MIYRCLMILIIRLWDISTDRFATFQTVTDGKNTAVISGGHAMMKKITGSGCMLSSVIGAFAAANPNNLFYAVSVAFGLYASCGRNAYKENIGIATYKNNFFDEMTNPDLEGIEIEYR